jgi:hypothetical protein
MKTTAITFISLLLFGCGTVPDRPVIASQAHDERNYVQVSLIRLLANPERYDGKHIMVEGIAYFDSKYGINGIFLSRDDKRAGNGLNGLFVVFDPTLPSVDHLNDQYVLARGTFRAQEKGHLSSFSSSLCDVTLVRPMKLNVK